MNFLQRSSFLAVLTALALAPAAHAGTSGSDIVGFANAQRTANGLPAVTEDPAASATCAAFATGSHSNSPTGSLTWNDTSPAIHGGPWTAAHDPFDDDATALPFVLAPRLAAFGAADANGFGCALVRAWSSVARPAPAADVTYSYPGDGATDARTSQPLDTGWFWDGVTQPTSDHYETGGVLYAFFDGPDFDVTKPPAATVTAASLTGPDGAPVAFDVRDATTRNFTLLSLPSEVQLVPRNPLQSFTKYTASVTADVTLPDGGPTRSFRRTWSFTTGALENAIHEPDNYGQGRTGDPSVYAINIYSRAPHVTVTATGPGTPVTTSADITPVGSWAGAYLFLHLDQPGTWHFCASSGGGDTGYRPASYCWDGQGGVAPKPAPLVVAASPKPKPVAAKVKVSILKSARARWRGRVVTVSGVRCSAACSLRVAGTVRLGGKNIKIGTKSVSRKGAGVVTIKYTISKSLAKRLRRAHARGVKLTIVPKGGSVVHAALAFSAAK